MCCIQTKHLQDNYDYWIAQLKEIKNASEREQPVPADATTTVTLEEIAETEIESEHDNELLP